jgi:hypothetical protein
VWGTQENKVLELANGKEEIKGSYNFGVHNIFLE